MSKRILSVILALITIISVSVSVDLSAYAIGSEYWYRSSNPNTFEEIYAIGDRGQFTLNDRYIFNWVREQDLYLEDYLSPEDIKQLKYNINSYEFSEESEALLERTDRICDDYIDTIISKLKLNSNISKVEKVYRVYNYVWISTHYVLDMDFFNNLGLVYHNGYCMNFANAIRDICNRAGVECNTIGSQYLNHLWNEVEIDGKIYVIDCTFGDDCFLQTPQYFNKIWERNAYLGSGTTYGTDEYSPKSNYSTKAYNFKKVLKNTSNYWNSATGKNVELTVVPACNGYLLSWKNDSKADYYLVRRKIFNGNKEVANERLKYVFPDNGGTTIFVDESPVSYCNYRFEYEVVKERFNCVTDEFGDEKYVKPTSSYKGMEHQWSLERTISSDSYSSLGADLYQCVTCKTKMMAYTSSSSCSSHDIILVVDSSGIVKKICAKCNESFGNTGEKVRRMSDIFPKNSSVKSLATPKLSKVTPKKKSVSVSWTKVNSASGYQVALATNKSFTSNQKIITIKGNTQNKTIKKLKSKKKYYVRVRAYKTVNGKKTYSKWSSAKTVKTK